MNLGTTDGGFGISYHHQHQHHRVVGHTVRRIGDILDGDAERFPRSSCRCGCIRRFSWRRTSRRLGEAREEWARNRALVADADATITRGQLYVRFRYCCIGDGRRAPKRGAISSEQRGLVLSASIDGDSELWDDGICLAIASWRWTPPRASVDAGDRVRWAAARAGAYWVTPATQANATLPARIRFSIRRRYGPAHRIVAMCVF